MKENFKFIHRDAEAPPLPFYITVCNLRFFPILFPFVPILIFITYLWLKQIKLNENPICL